MNELVLRFPNSEDPNILLTSITRLIDTGAEFAHFSIEKWTTKDCFVPFWMTRHARSTEILDGTLKVI